ncbi:MAG TPA: GAF domain-containing protein [Gammaproteobacteria bacterium]
MSLRQLLLTAFSVLVIGACLAVPFIPLAAQPFDANSVPGKTVALTVRPSSVGLPMPEGMQEGDLIYFSDLPPATRAYFMGNSSNPPVGTTLDIPVRRADGLHHIKVVFQKISLFDGSLTVQINSAANYLLMLLSAALGLLLLWRGQSRATFGVALWCLSTVLADIAQVVPVPGSAGVLFTWLTSVVLNVCTLIGLYLVADDLTASARAAERRRLAHWTFSAVTASYMACVLYTNGTIYFGGTSAAVVPDLVVVLHLVGFGMPLYMLAANYRRSAPLDQARIRWVLFSLCGLLAAYAMRLSIVQIALPFVVVYLIMTLLQAAAFIGFAYALLKHRLVSLQLVLNRTLVYGLITTLVVGVFAALLSFLERNTVNSETNKFLALIIPLVLGMGMHALKRQVDERINRLFFRNKHKAEAELTQFARTAPYVEDPEKLLDLTMDALYRNSGAQGVALYFTQKGKAGPKLVRKQGELPFPAKLDNDDLALLRLKAGDAEVNLRDTFSALEQEGFAYALTVRGEVMGFVVLGPRPSDAYSLEERRLFGLVAHQVAVAMHGLRLQEQQSLLRELAEGVFKSLPKARAKAKELIGAVG